MHPLAKRIALLVSLFSLVIGLFLLGYNLHFISEEAQSTALNLWPVLLVIAGFMLVFDSTKKRVSAHASSVKITQFPIPVPPGAAELAFRVQFSYGRLVVGSAAGAPCLVTEQVGSGASPVITQRDDGRPGRDLHRNQPAHFSLAFSAQEHVAPGPAARCCTDGGTATA